MIRKLVLAAVAATGTILALAPTAEAADFARPIQNFPPSVQAFQNPQPIFHRHHHYDVLVRRWNGWVLHGTYRDLCDAEHAANHLRHHGHRVQVVRD